MVPRNSLPEAWGINSKYKGGRIQIIPKGNGCALEIEASDPDTRDFHIFNREVFIETAPNETIKVHVSVCGTGDFKILGYVYDSEGKSIRIIEAEKLLDPGLNEAELKNFDFVLRIPEGKAKDQVPAKVRIAVSVTSGSYLVMESIKVESSTPQ